MSVLPDEIWRRILEMGIQNSKLNCKDLCGISISCRRLYRLCGEDALWSTLLSLDFPHTVGASSSTSPNFPSKTLYKTRFEKDKARKLAAHRRSVLRMESQVAVYAKSLKDLRRRLMEENERMKAVVHELSNFEKVRQASVALNVWQPEMIRGRQKQVVEQHGVPIGSRITDLEMELRLCKQQIAAFGKAYKEQQLRFDASKEQLSSLKYHPLRDYKLTGTGRDECNTQQKKLKRCSNMVEAGLVDRSCDCSLLRLTIQWGLGVYSSSRAASVSDGEPRRDCLRWQSIKSCSKCESCSTAKDPLTEGSSRLGYELFLCH